jgi:hypothetical protein
MRVTTAFGLTSFLNSQRRSYLHLQVVSKMGALQRGTNVSCFILTMLPAGLVALVVCGLAANARLADQGRVDFQGDEGRSQPRVACPCSVINTMLS